MRKELALRDECSAGELSGCDSLGLGQGAGEADSEGEEGIECGDGQGRGSDGQGMQPSRKVLVWSHRRPGKSEGGSVHDLELREGTEPSRARMWLWGLEDEGYGGEVVV